jgi:hypothetical protein
VAIDVPAYILAEFYCPIPCDPESRRGHFCSLERYIISFCLRSCLVTTHAEHAACCTAEWTLQWVALQRR